MATLLPHQHHRIAGTVKRTEKHVARVRAAQKREKAKEKERSPKWRATRKRFLAKNPECAACGARRGLQVHHVEPFHLNPGRELDVTNLITLCEYVGGLECHELLGHGDHWKCYVPDVRVLAAELRERPEALAEVRRRAWGSRLT